MSLRTTPRPARVTRNQIRPPVKSDHYVPAPVPYSGRGGYNGYGRGFGESRTQYGFQTSYTGVGCYGKGSRSCPGVAGRGGRTERRSWLTNRESEPEKFQKLKVSEPSTSNDAYDDISVEASGVDVPAPAISFHEIDFGECVNQNLKKSGEVMRTPVQRHAIPIAMAGRDLFACAPTGAGNTAAFCLPIISQVLLTKTQSPDDGDRWTVFPVGLILTPTKESACQICLEAERLAYGSGAKVARVYGGETMAQQLHRLERGVDILVATPGILFDLLERSRVSLKKIKYLALDEADRMLDMDYGSYIRNFVQQRDMPRARQTLIFSATFSVELLRLASDFLKNYIFLTVGTVGLKSNTDRVAQNVEFVKDMDKSKKKVPNWRHDYSEHSMHNGGDLSQRYGSRYFGGYDFRRSDSHYGSGSCGYGYSSAGVDAATFDEVSGSYAADSNNASESGNCRIVATTGTINALCYRKGEFIGAADTRDAFTVGNRTYILDDDSSKMREFQENMFVLYNGDLLMGKQILDHLHSRVASHIKKYPGQTIPIRRLGYTAYNHVIRLFGKCTMYFGGIEDEANILYRLGIDHDRTRRKSCTGLKEVKLMKQEDMILDGHVSRANDYWKNLKDQFSEPTERFKNVAARVLLDSALRGESPCGGSIALLHFKSDTSGKVVCTRIQRTVVEWMIHLYDGLNVEWFGQCLFFFLDKNDIEDEDETMKAYLGRWSITIKRRGYFNVGPPVAKILGKDLFLVPVEVDLAKRTEILREGDVNTTVLPNFHLRKFKFDTKIFYLTEPSKELLQGLNFEVMKEESIVPNDDKVKPEYMMKSL